MKVVWNDDRTREAKKLIGNWLTKYNCSCGESVYQRDSCQENAVSLVAELADLLVENEEGEL